jgi:hypothetical protein
LALNSHETFWERKQEKNILALMERESNSGPQFEKPHKMGSKKSILGVT